MQQYKSSLTLHDHPSISVIGKCLQGQFAFRALNAIEKKNSNDYTPTTKYIIKLEKFKVEVSINQYIDKGFTFFLTPIFQNFHCMQATSNSILLDILFPGYNDSDRDISYYYSPLVNFKFGEPQPPEEFNNLKINQIIEIKKLQKNEIPDELQYFKVINMTIAIEIILQEHKCKKCSYLENYIDLKCTCKNTMELHNQQQFTSSI